MEYTLTRIDTDGPRYPQEQREPARRGDHEDQGADQDLDQHESRLRGLAVLGRAVPHREGIGRREPAFSRVSILARPDRTWFCSKLQLMKPCGYTC